MSTITITIATYILFILISHSQYVTIWDDNMNQNNGWAGYSDHDFSFTSTECFNNKCAVVRGGTAQAGWIEKSTDVTPYSSVQLQIDLNAVKLETSEGDRCIIYYQFNNQGNDIWYKTGNDYANGRQGITVDFERYGASNILWIALEIDADADNDECYWDNAILSGIPYPTAAPTTAPTPSPTNNPTKFPTKYPTTFPSKTPTMTPSISTDNPTQSPTKYPTKFPTKYPSSTPSINPTAITKAPTVPTYMPTIIPTLAPSNTPTQSPETGLKVIPTLKPTANPSISTTSTTVDIMGTVTGIIEGVNSNQNENNIGTVYWVTVLGIAVIILCVLCLLLVFILIFKRKKRNAALKETGDEHGDGNGSQMRTTHSDNLSENHDNILNGIDTAGDHDIQRVASVSAGINSFGNTPFGGTPFGDVLDDVLNDANSGLQMVTPMSPNEDDQHDDEEIYGSGNDNVETRGIYKGSMVEGNNEEDSDNGNNELYKRNANEVTTQGPDTKF